MQNDYHYTYNTVLKTCGQVVSPFFVPSVFFAYIRNKIMRRNALYIVFLTLVGMLFLLTSCATAAAVEPQGLSVEQVPTVESVPEPAAPVAELVPEPAPVVEVPPAPPTSESVATPVEHKRYMKVRPVVPYGDRVILTNTTGYTLPKVDLFTESMFLASETMANLLAGSPLEDQQYREIFLADYPDLQRAIMVKDGSEFILNAIDTDGDLYYLTWKPETDPWNISIPFEALDTAYQPFVPVSDGEHIVFTNKTGYHLEDLYLVDPAEFVDGELGTDLLGPTVLSSGDTVEIAVEDVPWIADLLPFDVYARVLVFAKDTDGDEYRKEWYPTTDLWNITLGIEDLWYLDSVIPASGGDVLHITNNSDNMIWYLHLVTDEMYLMDEWGDDLLVDDILDTYASLEVVPLDKPWLQESIENPEGVKLHLLGFDVDDGLYHREWFPATDPWELVLTEDDYQF